MNADEAAIKGIVWVIFAWPIILSGLVMFRYRNEMVSIVSFFVISTLSGYVIAIVTIWGFSFLLGSLSNQPLARQEDYWLFIVCGTGALVLAIIVPVIVSVLLAKQFWMSRF